MAAVVAEQRPLLPRSEQHTPTSFGLALAMHALLVGALWLSVQWHTEPAGAVVVELWGSGAPEPPAIAVAPPPPPPPVRTEAQPERPDADIAIREEKKVAKKAEPPPPDTQKLEAERRRVEAEKRQAEEEAKRRETERKQAEAEAKRREAEKKQAEAERKKQAEAAALAAEQKRDEQRREAVRRAEEARVLAQAGSGTGGGNPNAAPGAGGGRGDGGYAGLLASVIKPRIVYAVPEGTSPSVYADFEVDLLPTGEILAVRLIRPSGLPGYDAAVERAIRRTDPFPRKPDGTVDRTVTIRFRPVEK